VRDVDKAWVWRRKKMEESQILQSLLASWERRRKWAKFLKGGHCQVRSL
jgi:hypothetical protein